MAYEILKHINLYTGVLHTIYRISPSKELGRCIGSTADKAALRNVLLRGQYDIIHVCKHCA